MDWREFYAICRLMTEADRQIDDALYIISFLQSTKHSTGSGYPLPIIITRTQKKVQQEIEIK